ncbi:MAG: hypothetical protein B7733_19335 [Myxococcales bacterium FL481]|nr:MAG: hypothetical protein B7733_19335 [Myxococcales bacterium FL481]
MSIYDFLPEKLVNEILDGVGDVPVLRRAVSRQVIGKYAAAAPPRPAPFSLAVDGYTTWQTLTDKRYSSRHLPICSDAYLASLPPEEKVVDLMMRRDDSEELARDTSLLFPFFAQWFTDSFLRTHPTDFRQNQSNHGIDLCQIYGLNEASTTLLRSHEHGRLKSQQTGTGEFGAQLFERDRSGAATLRAEFSGLYSAENFNRVFRDKMNDAQRLACFATGLEHGNSTLGNSLMNTVFLREHNRIAGELTRAHAGWDDERVFQTARLVNIAQLLKIVIEDYIKHIADYDLPLLAEAGIWEEETWYRTNWMAIEFNILYRWHGLIPNRFRVANQDYDSSRMLNANDLLLELGPEVIARDAASQKAGRIGLGHTPEFLRHVKAATVRLSRQAKLRPYNEYRVHFGLKPKLSFHDLTSNGPLAAELERLYKSIDNVDYVVGLLAEEYDAKSMMGDLQLTMVAHDAFTHALTNPLLASRVFNEDTFSPTGLHIISTTSTLADVISRNTGLDADDVSFRILTPS